jgi:D-alanine transaminase
MSIVYLNGRFLPLEEARVSPMDRGFLFADGVYEVIPIYQGKAFGAEQHLARLQKSLAAIKLDNPLTVADWLDLITKIVSLNASAHQLIYLQITRGIAEVRDHRFPDSVVPTVFIMSTPVAIPESGFVPQEESLSAITVDDIRWLRCDIKSIGLLPNILARQTAIENGADDAIFVRDGMVTECPAANVFLVKEGVIITPPLNEWILGGVTRDLVIALALENHIPCLQRPVQKMELCTADELWISSSTKDVMPVISLDGKPVGNGLPGELWRRMAHLYLRHKQALFGV